MKRSKRFFSHRGDSVSVLAGRVKRRFCVAVEEEFGYKEWLWFPTVTASELPAFWEGQAAFGFDFRNAFGGEWFGGHELPEGSEKYFLWLWKRLCVPGRFHAHLCCDNDSFLILPSGDVVTHQGCTQDFLKDDLPRIKEWEKKRVGAAGFIRPPHTGNKIPNA